MADRKDWKLFTPIQVGNLTLKNRVVYPPFETGWATADSEPTGRHLKFLTRVAAGGVGLIVLEAVNVNPTIIATRYGMGLYDDKFIPAFKKIVDSVHEAGNGVKIICQIVDKTMKRGMHLKYTEREKNRKPADYSKKEIAEIQDYFVAAAGRVKEAGFDGVQYHAAAMGLYTLGTFMSKFYNEREDEFGRTVDGLLKMTMDIHERTRKEVGPDFFISCRYNTEDRTDTGNTLKDGILMSRRMDQAGIDHLHPQFYAPRRFDATMPSAPKAWHTKWIKKYANLKHAKINYDGKVDSVQLAEELLQEDWADLIGWGRAIYRDPELPNKALAGRDDEINWCSWCNTCHDRYFNDLTAWCNLWSPEEKAYYEERGKAL